MMEPPAQAQFLRGRAMTRHVRPAVTNGQARFLNPLPATQSLRIDIVLPLRDQAGLDEFLREVYDPANPSYRRFLTVSEFTTRFGPSREDYDAVVQYARSNGLTVIGGSRDGMDVQLEGPVASIESAFHVSMGVYQHPTENRTFYSPDREPTVDLAFPLWHVSGLENYSPPKPTYMHKGSGTGSNATTGSGPSSSFLGSDMRAAYYGGTALTGSGQTVGLLEYYGYDIADLNTYFTNAKQKNNVPIDGISTDGTSLTCLYSKGCDDTEQIIDMTQAVSMAPGLTALYVYVGSTDTAIFSSMSTHSPLSAQLSSSWTWSPSDPKTDDPYFQKFAAQGQNLFQAAGDSSSYTSSSADVYPADDAHVTVVGGTDLQTSGPGGAWVSETVWVYGGGGYFTPDAIPIPSWQQLDGVITAANEGSTTLRNSPDVAANANFTFYVCADQTTCTANEYGGTSFAAPMWAGYLALVNQQSVAGGNSPLGFINPSIYQIGLGSGYATNFHDITSGNNGYPAEIGYDLASGWGSPNGAGLINALTGASAYFTISASPASVSGERGGNGTSAITTAAFNGFDSSISLSASGQPAGVTVTFNPATIAAPGSGSSTMTVAVASTTTVGTYTITVTGTSGSSRDSTSVTLLVPPIAVSVTPPEATLAPGQTQQFTATVINTTNTAVTWALNPNVGTISPTGLYTPPSTVSTQQAVTVTATSVADTTKSASATIVLVAPAGWYNLAWTSRKTLTINGTQVSGSSNLVNFPVLVSVTDPNLMSVANGGNVGNSNGNDILFTASDGATKLNHEIESYNAATGQLIAWVQVPTVSPTSDVVIYIYYGNPSAGNQQNPPGVWDSNYTGVWHFPSSTTLYLQDSTSNGNNGSPLNGPIAATGEIGGAVHFNGSSSYVNVGNLNETGDLTISAWVNTNYISQNTNVDDQAIVGKNLWDGNASGDFVLKIGRTSVNNGIFFNRVTSASTVQALEYDTSLSTGAWYYVVGTYSAAASTGTIYVNGASGASGNLGAAMSTNTHAVLIGIQEIDLHEPFSGVIDEVRISSTPRSAAWIATEYNNQSSPSTFVSEGAQQNSGAVVAPVFSPAGGTYASTQTVTISTTTAGASIRYTTDGSTPSETAGTLYSAPVTVSSALTLNAIAYKSGLIDSAVTTANYTFTGLSWYSASWTDRMPITIHHSQVAGASNLTNFPVLISLTNANLATVANGGSVGNSNGNDILFTASDGLTKLNHQIESYNATTGQLIAWVQVPTVSPTGDTVIYIYYGNPSAGNQQNPTAVWDSNFQEVLHLDESSGTTLFDSTSHGNNGSKVSASSPTPTSSGEIGGAQSFNGTSDYVVLPPSMTSGLTVFSVSFWTQTTDTVSNGTYWNQPQFVGDASNGSSSGDFGIVTNGGDLGMWSGLNGAGDNALVTSDVISDNHWHHIVAVNDGAIIWLYLDGQYTGQNVSAGLGLDSLGWYLGAQQSLTAGTANFFHQGSIDEFRFSNSVRSAGWIGTDYNNQSSPSTFFSVGPQQGSGLPPPVVTPTFSPAGGTYSSTQTVTIATTTAGASIRYTTNGSTPSETVGTLYSGAITVSATTTLNAIAYETGMTDSAVASATYAIQPQVATPAFSPAAGVYTSAQTVTISTTTPGASIRYTTNGSTPSETAGTPYSAPVTVSATTTINAIAYETGMTDSAVASATYSINITSSNTAQFVKTDLTTQGTWKGVYGSNGYNVIEDVTNYPSYVTVTPSGESNYIWSSSLSEPRALQKAESPTDRIAATWYNAGSFSVDVNISDGGVHQMALYFMDWDGSRTQTVAIQDATTHNVLDTRTLTSFYNGEYLVWNLTGHVTVVITQTGALNAVVSGLFFDPQAPVGTPAFSPIPGTYIPAQTVTIGTATSGASIRYTTDGSTPSETAGTLYSGPITVSATTTINAIAYASGVPDSAVSTATFTISGSNWYSTSWTDRIPITIHHSQVAGASNLTNFPVLISLTNANLATVANGGNVGNSNGNDILFTASDGLTKLNHQIESYNATTGQLIAWVQVPTVSPTGDAVIYIYYGNSSAANQQNPAAVWDSNFQEVLHLDESSGTTLFDSTSHGNNGSKVSATSPTPTSSGEIGGAQSFNGTSDYVVLPPSMTNGLTMFSVSFWTQTTDTVSNGTYWNQPQFVGDASNGSSSGDFGLVTNNGDLGMWSGLNGAGDNALVTSDLISDNHWHHIVAVNNGAIIWLYLDGQYTGQNLTSGLGLDSLGWYLGAQQSLTAGTANFFHQGSIDEFRFSNSVRSAGWIGTEYNNQSSPSTFFSVGPQQGSGLPPPVVTPTFSPAAGTYSTAQTVTISTTTSGASIRYTTNGSTPSETAGTPYSAPVTVSATTTINAIAYETGMTDSSVASAIYAIQPQVAMPAFSPAAGVYTSAQTVTISTTTPGASIRYTTNGSTPSETAGTPYSAPVTVSATTTINAIAYETGMTDSAVASATYSINITSSNTAQFVKTDLTTQGTWKGVYGSNGYNVIEDVTNYPSYVTVTPSGESNYIWSSSLSEPRALQKAESPTDRIAATWYNAGSFSVDVNISDGGVHQMALYFMDWDGSRTQTVAIQDATTHNVLDTRTLTSFYNGEYLVWNLTGHVTVVITQTGALNAVVSGLFFDPQAPVGTPAFSPIPGTYIPAQTVTIGTATSGASIRYTTDGSTPSETAGTLYSGPITVSATTTINAIAYASGVPDSAVSTATFTISGSNWYSTSWTDRIPITIHHSQVAGASNLTNFPVLISLTNANLATVANGGNVGNSNGNDILFTASDGLTKLNHQIESYNATTGQLIAWVQVPTVSPTGDAVIYIYYGNSSAANQQNPAAVWDSNFQEVLHLDESSGTTLFDSTSHGNNGSKVSATSPTPTSSGEIGGAQSFNGTSDYVVLPPSMTSGLTVFSVSFWTQTTDTVSNGTYWNQPQFVGDASNGSSSGDFGLVTNNGDLGMWSGLNGAGDNALVTSDVISDNHWHHIVAVNDGAIIWLYLDGQYTGQNLTSGLGLDSLGWYLGAQQSLTAGTANFFHQGSIDEFRFSNSVRSAGWIGTDYNNQSSPSTFVTVGPQQGSGLPSQ
jgi:kumamolisin